MGVVLAILVVIALMVWNLQRQLMYHPGGAPPPVEQVLPAGEEVTLETTDGLELAAGYLMTHLGYAG